ncbi:hypothetical protein [Sporosarcina sp. FSL K6-5500]|uniref:hypothetical protein n=1 Tax=Sporosarcina sp. FSL K6-5500 TaxID=2921558 RepID=UPI0030FD1385
MKKYTGLFYIMAVILFFSPIFSSIGQAAEVSPVKWTYEYGEQHIQKLFANKDDSITFLKNRDQSFEEVGSITQSVYHLDLMSIDKDGNRGAATPIQANGYRYIETEQSNHLLVYKQQNKEQSEFSLYNMDGSIKWSKSFQLGNGLTFSGDFAGNVYIKKENEGTFVKVHFDGTVQEDYIVGANINFVEKISFDNQNNVYINHSHLDEEEWNTNYFSKFDSDGNLIYEKESEFATMLNVDKKTGSLFLKEPLDYENGISRITVIGSKGETTLSQNLNTYYPATALGNQYFYISANDKLYKYDLTSGETISGNLEFNHIYKVDQDDSFYRFDQNKIMKYASDLTLKTTISLPENDETNYKILGEDSINFLPVVGATWINPDIRYLSKLYLYTLEGELLWTHDIESLEGVEVYTDYSKQTLYLTTYSYNNEPNRLIAFDLTNETEQPEQDGYPTDKVWTVTFNKVIDAKSLKNNDYIYIETVSGEKLQNTLTLDSTSKKVQIAPPTGNYTAGEYKVVVNNRLVSEDGKQLKQNYTKEFEISAQ